jgi:hypothetical protein
MLALVGLIPWTAAAETATQVKLTAERAVAVDAATQQAVEAWEAEKQQLLANIDRTRTRLQNVDWQQRKATDYSATLNRKIEALKLRAAEMEKINVELLPLLNRMLDRLQSFVAADLPWQQTERRRNLAHTRQLLNDYDTGLLPKTRAVLETLAREADLGHTVAVREAEISVDGQPRQVRLLQVGRLGLYALTMDGRQAYAWNGDLRSFRALDEGRRDIGDAMQMAEGTRILALSRLPVGQPGTKTTAGGSRVNGK